MHIVLRPDRLITVKVWPSDRPQLFALISYEMTPVAAASTTIIETTDTHLGWALELGAMLASPILRLVSRRVKRKQVRVMVEQHDADVLAGMPPKLDEL
jgi:hypothetical protein